MSAFSWALIIGKGAPTSSAFCFMAAMATSM